MSRKLTQKEFDEIATLARTCIDAYSSTQVKSELRRLEFLSNVLDIAPYVKGVIGELHSYSLEASKQKPHNEKDHWVKQATWTLNKLQLHGVEREETNNG